ncbi:hypothetical protein OEZ85_003830 [Tetradesmus obliquus]|uniref:BHLH domain-containing protein n=1 Tax=Tetradesmus obliquus TaxID=3088 RepID=A0ABY8UD15_TETOB|nr:hypothetical protein OEZ85_003830 [Tetradesmus obliquus]
MEGDAPAATSAKGPFAGRQQQPSLSGATSHGPGVTSDLAGLSGCNTGDVGFRLPTTTRSSDFGPNKQNKHRAAEQRRRERINEKLAQLRELVAVDKRDGVLWCASVSPFKLGRGFLQAAAAAACDQALRVYVRVW